MSCGGGGSISSVTRRSYGSFVNTTNQTASLANTAYSLELNKTELSNQISVVSGSRITFLNTGIYDLQFSAQLNKASGSPANIDIWLAYTGSNVDDTNTRVTVAGSQAKAVAAWDFMFEVLNPNDYVELKWSVTNADVYIYSETTGSTPTRPALPSLIVTVFQI